MDIDVRLQQLAEQLDTTGQEIIRLLNSPFICQCAYCEHMETNTTFRALMLYMGQLDRDAAQPRIYVN